MSCNLSDTLGFTSLSPARRGERGQVGGKGYKRVDAHSPRDEEEEEKEVYVCFECRKELENHR